MKAVAAYAKAKEAMGFALRALRPALLLREIQVISQFYTPGRLLSVMARYFPEDLHADYARRMQVSNAHQGAIEHRCYEWIQANAHLYAERFHVFYLDHKDVWR